MSALLLALILGMLLEQGSRAQRTVSCLGDNPGATGTVTGGLILAVIGNAAIAAMAGGLLAGLMPSNARLLFFAASLLSGGGGLLYVTLCRRGRADDAAMIRSPLRAIGLLALRRAGDNASFAIAGIAVFTQAPWLAATGASLGGLAALLPALILGRRYSSIVPLRAIGAIAGTILLCIGIACTAAALGLSGN